MWRGGRGGPSQSQSQSWCRSGACAEMALSLPGYMGMSDREEGVAKVGLSRRTESGSQCAILVTLPEDQPNVEVPATQMSVRDAANELDRAKIEPFALPSRFACVQLCHVQCGIKLVYVMRDAPLALGRPIYVQPTPPPAHPRARPPAH